MNVHFFTVTILTALAFGTGCKTGKVGAPPKVIDANEFGKGDSGAPDLKNYPVIDMHSHTFNARYLPLKNIALARRYDKLPCGLGYLISSEAAVLLAEAIISRTDLSPMVLGSEALSVAKGEMRPTDRQLGELWTNIAVKAFAPEIYNQRISGGVKSRREIATEKKAVKEAEDAAQQLFGEEIFGKGQIPKTSFLRFLHFITSGEVALRAELKQFEFPEVDLFVQHMMDLGPAYDQQPNGNKFLDFTTEQVQRAQFFDAQPGSKAVRFVAFSPFRARGKDGTIDFELAWKPIQKALDNGAVGIKFYPPSGYRPTDNKIPRRPWVGRELRQQWDGRYKGFSDESLDRVMLEFFKRCVARDIPVFAHCQEGEFQAAKNYGKRHADPKYWLSLFEKHEELRKLRLCLGHSGGPEFWFNTRNGTLSSWGEKVVQLCTDPRLPNIYCEVGVLDQIATEDPSAREFFANRVLQCIRDSNGLFGKRIMYGSDWFMPIDVNPRSGYLDGYRQVFLTRDLRPYYEDFFCQNALRFLNLTEKQVNVRATFGAQYESELKRLVRVQGD